MNPIDSREILLENTIGETKATLEKFVAAISVSHSNAADIGYDGFGQRAAREDARGGN